MSEKKPKLRRNTLPYETKKRADSLGDKKWLTFVKDFDNGLDASYSYRDMHLISNRLGNGLMRLGLKKGDGIGLMEPNSPEFLFSIFASFKIGTYTVLVNIALKGDGLAYILNHSDAKAIIINHSYLEAFLEIKEQLKSMEHVIVDLNEAPEDFKLPEGAISLQEVMKASDDDIYVDINLDDLALLMYTAGTTGLPKAVSFWQGKLIGGHSVTTIERFTKFLFLQGDDVLFTALPLFHSNALFLTTFCAYLNNVPLILGKRFSASRHWGICRKYGVTCFNTLGAMISFLMKQPEKPDDKNHNVRYIHSAACPKELWVAFENRFNVKIKEFYAATDGGGFMLTAEGHDNVPIGTMGKPLGGVITEVMDDDGNILPEPEAVGELVYLVKETEVETRTVKYYKDKKSSEGLIERGADGQLWFHTGDLAYKDKDGWFYFVDRKKDSIRRRGENIAAWSIEEIINKSDKVLESAAYGVKTELGEDEVMVAVVLKPGETMTPEELLDFCEGKMASFMIPRYIDFMDSLPKNEVHRILKRELKERGITPSTFDREKTG